MTDSVDLCGKQRRGIKPFGMVAIIEESGGKYVQTKRLAENRVKWRITITGPPQEQNTDN